MSTPDMGPLALCPLAQASPSSSLSPAAAMPGKVIPCALCPDQAAAFYCVNDDAHLCAACDASVHAANPLLARHERRALNSITCQTAECASAACTPAAPSCATDGDVAVVPQFCGGEEAEVQAPSPRGFMAAPTTDTSAAPLTLYEDSFFSRNLTTSDLLDLDSDELELPGGPALPFSFNPMVDCVVPSFDANPFMPQQVSSCLCCRACVASWRALFAWDAIKLGGSCEP